MDTHHAHSVDHAGASHGTTKSYVTGFILSIILTVIPFAVVMQDPGLSRTTIVVIIAAMAVIQIVVHLVYFLHLNGASERRWNAPAFAFTILIALLLIGGSVWIMDHLSDNSMPTQEPTQ